MSDWSQIELCPECGVGNPAGERTCIGCSTDLQQARSKEHIIREQNIASIMKNRPQRGSRNKKPVTALTISDLQRFPVWEFDLAHEGLPGHDESWVIPVRKLPVTDLANRVIGTKAQLASGKSVYCLLGNIDLQHEQKTTQFLTATLLKADGDSFFLARYFDVDYARQGPEALADFLALPVEEVFPISYDISSAANGLETVTKGLIKREMTDKLSDEERFALVFR